MVIYGDLSCAKRGNGKVSVFAWCFYMLLVGKNIELNF